MQTISKLSRPVSLQDEMVYLRVERCLSADAIEPEPVKFLGYDPCPALVWVCAMDGKVTRCPRDELFIMASSTDYASDNT